MNDAHIICNARRLRGQDNGVHDGVKFGRPFVGGCVTVGTGSAAAAERGIKPRAALYIVHGSPGDELMWALSHASTNVHDTTI